LWFESGRVVSNWQDLTDVEDVLTKCFVFVFSMCGWLLIDGDYLVKNNIKVILVAY